MRYFVFPQMLGYLTPAATNERTSLAKASLRSTITVTGPTMAAQRGRAARCRHAGAMIETARAYRLVHALAGGVARGLESRLQPDGRRVAQAAKCRGAAPPAR